MARSAAVARYPKGIPMDWDKIAVCELGVDAVSERMPATIGVLAGTPSVNRMSPGRSRPRSAASRR